MRRWWSGSGRLFSRYVRIPVLVGILLVLATLTGCAGGGLRHESWPGMIVVDGTIYAANLEHVQALNAETGKLLWSFPDESDRNSRPFYSTPVLAPDYGPHGLLLIAGFKDQTVYALALGESPAERPDVLWTFAQAAGQYVGSGVVAGDKFLIGNGDGKVYALSLEDGSLIWAFPTKDRVWATPVVVDDTVYIGALDHHLYAVDLATGQEKWKLEMKGSISATPVVIDGYLWVGDFSGALCQVDVASGSVVWTYAASNWIWATPAVEGTTLFFADVEGQVYALDTATRTLLWWKPASLGDVVHGRPALNATGTLLLVPGYKKGEIHALDTETGVSMNWGVVSENPGRLPGDLVVDGQRLYAMPIWVGERIQAFDLDTGKVLWAYPPPVAQ